MEDYGSDKNSPFLILTRKTLRCGLGLLGSGPVSKWGLVFRESAAQSMVDRIENLKALADEYSIRSAAKLRKQALLEGVRVSIREAQEALKTDLGRQVFGPKPRSRGKSAAEGANDPLQFDLIDYAANTSKNKSE